VKKVIAAIVTLVAYLVAVIYKLADLVNRTISAIKDTFGCEQIAQEWKTWGWALVIATAAGIVALLTFLICLLIMGRPPGKNGGWERHRIYIAAVCIRKGLGFLEGLLTRILSEAETEGLPNEESRRSFVVMVQQTLRDAPLWFRTPAIGQIDGDLPRLLLEWEQEIVEIRRLIRIDVFDPINNSHNPPRLAISKLADGIRTVLRNVRDLQKKVELEAQRNRPKTEKAGNEHNTKG